MSLDRFWQIHTIFPVGGNCNCKAMSSLVKKQTNHEFHEFTLFYGYVCEPEHMDAHYTDAGAFRSQKGHCVPWN